MNIKLRLAKLEAEAAQESSELYSSFKMVAEDCQDQHIAEMRAAGYVVKDLGGGFTAYRHT